ncbi:hypothetical protein BST43_12280 [Mycobacteroides saopaulense]|uniref:Uncharacterized protein n=1 Tax=Mycobacteroides saopaulense TaxID=1578165 RepID=A0A1X0J6D2_9MYCO|nr:hypothetical protein BST43_12280 [Mycobacteroides saopaulense]
MEFSRSAFGEIASQARGNAPSRLPPVEHPDAQEFLVAAAAAAAECDRLRQILAPEAAIEQWLHIDASIRDALIDSGFLGRARWVLAVGATGTSTDAAVVNEFFDQAIRWWVASLMADAYRHDDSIDVSVALSIDAMPGRQFLARTTSMAIRYHWACKKIATQIVREVSADSDFANELPEFTLGNLDRIFNAARRHADGAPPIAINDNKGMELAALMAVDAGALSALPFATAAKSNQMEMQPWVRFGDALLPCPAWQVLMELERSLLAAADARLVVKKKPGVDKGTLFERAAYACIVEAIGHECRNLSHGFDITIAGTREPRDVDIALVGKSVQVLGEVKSYEVTNSDGGALNSYGKQVGDVFDQLHKRLSSLDAGIPLIGRGDSAYHYGADAIGLGVVLHPYNSSLGDLRMLAHVTGEADTARIAVADLHSWLLILNGLDGVEDLRDYLRFREDCRLIGWSSFEECDFALPYFSPQRDIKLAQAQKRYAAHDPSKPLAALLQVWAVKTELALETKAPKDRRAWRRKFFRDCEPNRWSEGTL